MPDRRPWAHVQGNYDIYTSILEAQTAQVLGPGAGAVGKLSRPVKVKGASYDLSETKTDQQPNVRVY